MYEKIKRSLTCTTICRPLSDIVTTLGELGGVVQLLFYGKLSMNTDVYKENISSDFSQVPLTVRLIYRNVTRLQIKQLTYLGTILKEMVLITVDM